MSISGSHLDNPDQRQYDVYFAEPVRSLRAVMRRAHPNVPLMADSVGGAASDKLKHYGWVNTIFPYFNGFDPTANFSATSYVTGGKNYAWAINTPFHMWIPCFKGIRGSIYWHYESQAQSSVDRLSMEVRRELFDPPLATSPQGDKLNWTRLGFTVSAGNINSMVSEEIFSYDYNTDYRSAAVLVSPFNGEGKSVLMPNMFNYRFDTTRVSAFCTGQNRPRLRRERVIALVRYSPRSSNLGDRERDQMIRRYFSIGPDFTTFFFLCVPRIYRYTSVPGAF